MPDPITIAVDAVGGDKGSSVMLSGAKKALEQDSRIELIMVGPADVVEPFAASHQRVVAQVATESISMREHPAQAVRTKKDSSIVVGCRLVKEGRAKGFYSPGSTGACLTAATLVIGRIKGVARPALATILPALNHPVVLCDVGANADCKPSYLVQFAQMASIYAEIILDIKNPSVALVNIGEEETKGSQFALDAYKLLKENVPSFIGNAEGGDLFGDFAHVYVTDGFTGNVCLKLSEGLASTLFALLKKVMYKNTLTKIGALTMKDGLMELKTSVSSDTYGATPLLGVKGVCMVGHGSSNEEAVKNSILNTAKCISYDLEGRIIKTVSSNATKNKQDITTKNDHNVIQDEQQSEG